MSVGIGAVVVLLCLLQVKHMAADFFLQSKSMLDGRDVYVHAGRCAHAGVHAAGSALVFALLGSPAGFIILLVLAEGVVHYHIDWLKGRYTTQRDLTPRDAPFWWATGVDQALHQATYIAMLWLWTVYGLA